MRGEIEAVGMGVLIFYQFHFEKLLTIKPPLLPANL
jgi:hypothetical protein